MLEKEFVPYQESLELKELGFDEPCFGLFVRDKSLLIKEMPNQEECQMFFGGILAPTYSQAFRWFREKYGLWQIIQQNTDKDWTYDILPIIGMIDYKLFDVFDTYEEAELACLRKLIEIVKEKQ